MADALPVVEKDCKGDLANHPVFTLAETVTK